MKTLLAALAAILLGAVAVDTADAKNPVVVIETSEGKIKIELLEDKSPITVKNFLGYVKSKHYDGTIFHRVIKNFMIQGGGFKPGLEEKAAAGQPIKNEASNGLSNKRGTVAMARTGDPNSAKAQFFINVSDDNTFLDYDANAPDPSTRRPPRYGYAVFGKVTEGMDVVDKIRNMPTRSVPVNRFQSMDDVPAKDVVIKSVRVLEDDKKKQ